MKIRQRCRKPTGFTLIETLLALLCISIAMVMLVPCMNVMKSLLLERRYSDDRIALHQLRIMLAQARDVRMDVNTLQFQYRKEQITLSYDAHRLIRQPGYEIFLENIDAAVFQDVDTCIQLQWKRGEQAYVAPLWCR